MKKKRYLLVDGIRGLAIVNMVAFHFLYDVYVVFGRNLEWYVLPGIRIWQQAICWTFILVAGFVWRFGKENNFRRGVFFHLCGGGVSLVTWLVAPKEVVWFGILNFMGSAVLFMAPLCKLFRKIPAWFGMIASIICFALFQEVQKGYLGIGGKVFFELPEGLYRIKILTPFGFPFPDFSSSDYFPLFPWLFLFLTGYFLYPLLKESKFWKRVGEKRIPLFSGIGQKSIWIYLAHQPICMGVISIYAWLLRSL
ncbi:MAG: DUF1624 domain-containing protein [Lachnospiraceae bacterium]|nr:DUF1624 domain-containing protein [Lachnospiraceae bacterium]